MHILYIYSTSSVLLLDSCHTRAHHGGGGGGTCKSILDENP